MDDAMQDRIRRRAHEIWEREGARHGRHEEHWAQAEAEIRAESEREAGARTGARTGAADEAAGTPAETAKTTRARAPRTTAKQVAQGGMAEDKTQATGTAPGTNRVKGAAGQAAPAGDPGRSRTKSASPAATAAKRPAAARKASTRTAAEKLSAVSEGPGEAGGQGARGRR